MKILVVTMPCFGDNIPMAGLVEELGKRGHQVDVISSSANIPRIKALFCSDNVNFIDFDIKRLPDYAPGRVVSVKDDAEIFSLQIEEAFYKADEYDAVVYDYFAFPMYYLTKKSKVCLIRYYANFAFEERLAERIFVNDVKVLAQNAHANEVGSHIISSLSQKGFAFDYGSMREEVVNNIPNLTIVHTLKDMQPFEECFDERFVYVGACTSRTSQYQLDIPYDRMKGKIIYISFGTVLTEIGDCRKALYQMMIEAFHDEDVSVIMSVGENIRLEEFGDIPDNFFIYKFVPQTEVLEHADLFITHCGMNSTNDAIYAGVPMIGIPGGYDQRITAELLEPKKIGYEIRPDEATVELVKKLSFDVLENDEIKSNMKQLQNKIRSFNSDVKAADIIEEYIRKNKGL